MAAQRAQMGCCLLHLTFDAAQASHEARSLGFRSGTALEDCWADVVESVDMVEVVEAEGDGDDCHSCVEETNAIVLEKGIEGCSGYRLYKEPVSFCIADLDCGACSSPAEGPGL